MTELGYSPELKAEVVRRYEEGTPVRVIAAEFGVDSKSVRTWVTAAGVELRPFVPVGEFLDEADMAQALAWREAGVSIERIAERLQRSYRRVKRTLAAAGLGPVDARSRFFTDEQRAEMVRLYRDGMSTRNVASKMGASQVTVVKAARAAGVPVRLRGGAARDPSVPPNVRAAARDAALLALKERYRCEYDALFAAELAARS